MGKKSFQSWEQIVKLISWFESRTLQTKLYISSPLPKTLISPNWRNIFAINFECAVHTKRNDDKIAYSTEDSTVHFAGSTVYRLKSHVFVSSSLKETGKCTSFNIAWKIHFFSFISLLGGYEWSILSHYITLHRCRFIISRFYFVFMMDLYSDVKLSPWSDSLTPIQFSWQTAYICK